MKNQHFRIANGYQGASKIVVAVITEGIVTRLIYPSIPGRMHDFLEVIVTSETWQPTEQDLTKIGDEKLRLARIAVKKLNNEHPSAMVAIGSVHGPEAIYVDVPGRRDRQRHVIAEAYFVSDGE